MSDQDKKAEYDINSKLKIAEFTEALKAGYSLDAERDRLNTQISMFTISGLFAVFNSSSTLVIKYFNLWSMLIHFIFIISIILFVYNIFLNIQIFKLNKNQIDILIYNLINIENNRDDKLIIQIDNKRTIVFQFAIVFGVIYSMLALGAEYIHILLART